MGLIRFRGQVVYVVPSLVSLAEVTSAKLTSARVKRGRRLMARAMRSSTLARMRPRSAGYRSA